MTDEANAATAQMEADIKGLASRLAPERPVVTAFTNRDGGGIPVASIGAAAVGKRLEALIKTANDLRKSADVLAVALAGPVNDAPRAGAATRVATEHLFGKQMAALDELSAVLDSVGRSIERAQRSLA